MEQPSQVDIRDAQTRDVDDIVHLMQELVVELGPQDDMPGLLARLEPDIRQAFGTAQTKFFVAEHAGKLIGLTRGDILVKDPIFRLREDHRCGYVDQMYVQPAFRQDGVGQRLLEALEAWFRSQHLSHAILHAAPKAARLYARLGYQPNREMFKLLS